ncbi:hypothetical protein ACFY64_06880 [Streptomyces collinus]|uniref:VMAP-C domain-containing protein n=1 Tax=Streptomyces collinus TaxID=42684 RepID=UPI00367CDAE3
MPDLAVIGLDEKIEHPCVWLSDLSTPPGGTSGQLVYRGFRLHDGAVSDRTGVCTVEGTDDRYGLRLGIQGGEVKPGLSGGPVVDLGRGAVVAVVKARSNKGNGGTSVQITALRELRSAGGQPYQELIRSHDRWHRAVYRRDRSIARTWAREQSKLANASSDFSPEDRVEALGLLAELPDAPDHGTVLSLVEKACQGAYEMRMPLPVSWRDGAGLLYDPVHRGETEAVLDYLLRVAGSVHEIDPVAAQTLQDWALERAGSLPEHVRSDLRRLAVVRERVVVAAGRAGAAGGTAPQAPGGGRTSVLEPPTPLDDSKSATHDETTTEAGSAAREEPPSDLVAPDPAAPPATEAAVVLLELRHDWWLEDHYHWTVRLLAPTGDAELVAVGQDLAVTDLAHPPQEVRDGLNRSFLRADAGNYAAPLEVLVPQKLFDLPFDAWRVNGPPTHEGEGGPLGHVRPVSIVDQRHHGPDLFELPQAARGILWPLAGGTSPRMVRLLDAHRSSPAPDVVLFHCGPVHGGPAGAALREALDAGFTTAVWYRAEAPFQECEHVTEGVRRMLDRIRTPAEVAAAVTALRADHAAADAQHHWARHLAVLHHEPGRRPATADLLDTP